MCIPCTMHSMQGASRHDAEAVPGGHFLTHKPAERLNDSELVLNSQKYTAKRQVYDNII